MVRGYGRYSPLRSSLFGRIASTSGSLSKARFVKYQLVWSGRKTSANIRSLEIAYGPDGRKSLTRVLMSKVTHMTNTNYHPVPRSNVQTVFVRVEPSQYSN